MDKWQLPIIFTTGVISIIEGLSTSFMARYVDTA
jgi:hypothetical protein